MKKIVAINASPRKGWNTSMLVQKAAEGAQSAGAEIKSYNLYDLEKYTGCVSCFACKLPGHEGRCLCKDGLFPVLEDIRTADGLIIGTPNYLGDASAAFRALYERLIFQFITYKSELHSYSTLSMPVLLVMTSNVAEESYPQIGYAEMLSGYQKSLSGFVGPTKLLISGNTLQVNNYDKFQWDVFNPEEKKERRQEVFPQELQKAFDLGVQMLGEDWQ